MMRLSTEVPSESLNLSVRSTFIRSTHDCSFCNAKLEYMFNALGSREECAALEAQEVAELSGLKSILPLMTSTLNLISRVSSGGTK